MLCCCASAAIGIRSLLCHAYSICVCRPIMSSCCWFRPFDPTKATNSTGSWCWVGLPKSVLINGRGNYHDCEDPYKRVVSADQHGTRWSGGSREKSVCLEACGAWFAAGLMCMYLHMAFQPQPSTLLTRSCAFLLPSPPTPPCVCVCRSTRPCHTGHLTSQSLLLPRTCSIHLVLRASWDPLLSHLHVTSQVGIAIKAHGTKGSSRGPQPLFQSLLQQDWFNLRGVPQLCAKSFLPRIKGLVVELLSVSARVC